MSTQMIGQVIQQIVAPVVMVTACAIIISGMMTEYGAINDRIRGLDQERLNLLRAGLAAAVLDPVAKERIGEIDTQVPRLVHRHEQVQIAILLAYGAILCLVASMISIAIATRVNPVATVTLVLFLGGVVTLLVSIAWMAREIRGSHDAVRFDAQTVRSLSLETLREKMDAR
jgi:drug/metabolite transporter (DMT)-like permease